MKKVLIVDDIEDNRLLVKKALSRHYEVLTAHDGKVGLEAAFGERPDLVLMDLFLPVLNGWEAIQKIRADDSMKGVKIMAYTAFPMEGDEEKSRKLGCDGYITKPILPGDLRRKVAELLD